MNLPISCPTSHAVLLLAVMGHDHLLHFPFATNDPPGIVVEVAPHQPLVGQLFTALQVRIPQLSHGLTLEFVNGFSAKLTVAPPTTLYLARTRDAVLASFVDAVQHSLTLPALLRQMRNDKNRLPYLRAWQTLMGVGEEEVLAVTAEDLKKSEVFATDNL